jgi:phage terminase large subunit
MVCLREVQKDLTQSSKMIIEDKIAKHGLTEADGFKIFRDVIETPGMASSSSRACGITRPNP